MQSSKPSNQISREALADGTMLRQFTQLVGAHSVLTPQERARRFDELMASIPAGSDLWLFAYGSMMWNPTVHFAESKRVTVAGWQRSFCLRSLAGRGSPERPGLMLGIEPGGQCQGLAYRLASATIREEMHILWQREMVTGAYQARWVQGVCDGNLPFNLVTFVIDPSSYAYEGKIAETNQVQRICAASGMLGSNREYLMMTRSQLRQHGICDPYIERLALAAEQYPVAAAAGENSTDLPPTAR